MSNQLFAWLLMMQGGTTGILLILYFFIKRREPMALVSSLINGLFGLFFWLLGGGVKEPAQAGIYIYATALGLLFSQFALIAVLLYHIGSGIVSDRGRGNAGIG